MTDDELIAGMLYMIDLESRAELEHVLSCKDCSLWDMCDPGGPYYCDAFFETFRGREPAKPVSHSSQYVSKLWSQQIMEALQRDLHHRG